MNTEIQSNPSDKTDQLRRQASLHVKKILTRLAKIIFSWQSIVVCFLILFIFGFTRARHNAGEKDLATFVGIWWVCLGLWVGVLIGMTMNTLYSRYLKNGHLRNLLKLLNIPLITVLVFPILFLYWKMLFTVNGPNVMGDSKLIIDGKPITHSNKIRVNPFIHDIQVVDYYFGVHNLNVTGTTKDGVGISTDVSLNLRRSDDPKAWVPKKQIEESINTAIRERFSDTVSRLNLSEIQDRLVLEFNFLDQGNKELRGKLPPHVQLNGEIKIAETHIFKKE